MCTVSFIPTSKGFLLGMNRDEQRVRAKALPPDIHECGSLSALYPSEPSGGTWIGLNETGLTIALINWYSKPQLTGRPAFSRGEIIPKLLTTRTLQNAEILLRDLPLSKLNPFRLIVVSAKEQSIHEFRSDAVSLDKALCSWKKTYWFSSGYDEPEAMRQRGMICEKETYHPDTYSPIQLRKLHRSHAPDKGAFSICMHRDDATTVSYSEVVFEGKSFTISYLEGTPCNSLRGFQNQLSRTLDFNSGRGL